MAKANSNSGLRLGKLVLSIQITITITITTHVDVNEELSLNFLKYHSIGHLAERPCNSQPRV
jgi:hypothetical protein